MTSRFHGITSLGLVGIATLVAAAVMFQTSMVLGLVYVALCGGASGVVIYAYCAKCPCKAYCAHILPGKAASIFKRQPGPYTLVETGLLVLALLLLAGLPQVWLWGYKGLFLAYWLLNAIALTQIRRFVCKACDNVYCPAKPQKGN